MNAVDEVGVRSRARSQMYSFLAVALGYPDDVQLAALKQQYDVLPGSLEKLADPPSKKAVDALRPAIAALTAASLGDGYTRCFGHAMSKDCPPYEAEYGQAHIFQKTHTLADIAGFYRAFGLDLAADSHERVDHISVELEFMHFLCLKEVYALANKHPDEQLALCREAQGKFLRDHVCRWAFGFARRLCAKAGDTLYQELGQLLAAFLEAELRALGLKPAEVAGPDLVEEGAPALPEAEAGLPQACEACCGLEGAR
ncbi:MAG: molecular chaperone TorD family protein [Betaproteobacteria bacterium]|nr:molecular chaperone TorD family protein [Betaproteobacteria bacterium]